MHPAAKMRTPGDLGLDVRIACDGFTVVHEYKCSIHLRPRRRIIVVINIDQEKRVCVSGLIILLI